jgi:class 3 adenylate cyclase
MHERRAVHRTIVVLDIERFGDPRRTDLHKLSVREGLYRSVGEAFQQAELPWTPDTHEDRGDGILVVLPPEVHKSLLVELLPSALVAALTAHNRAHPDEEGIRLRMSLHAGEVRYDQHGVTGQAVNWAFRLVDAKLLKAALASSSGVLAIIASSWFFDQVIRHAAGGIPSVYRRVLVRAKDDTRPGWICLPDDRRTAGAVTSPYKGLRAFEKEDENLFFGRENAVRQLMGAVAASALVPVVGKSGVGKSSLVQAGLLPALDKTGWAVETILPRPDLPMALAAALARLSGAPPIVPLSKLDAWQDYLSLHGLTAAAEKARKDRKWERAVIVIDQFEEALVQEEESGPILRQLGDLRDGGLLTVVLTLREDSFGALFVSQETFGECLRRNAVPLRGMDKSELIEAIRLPAEWHGIDVTDPLVEELVEAIRDNSGALPLLEFSLDQMWRALPPAKETLSSDEYRRIHGLNGALAAHADRVLDSLTAVEQAMVRNCS